MKKIGFISALAVAVMSCLCMSSCSDKDEPDSNGGGATSGTVTIGNSSFSVKYGYLIEESDEDYTYFDVICSDTDLSGAMKGNSFAKTVSYIMLYAEKDYYYNSTYTGAVGCHKCYVDSRTETVECKENDSFLFDYYNPSYSDTGFDWTIDGKKYAFSGSKYTFSGSNLSADIYKSEDAYDYDRSDGTVNLSFSITTTPVDMTKYLDYDDYDYAPSRAIQLTVVTDPAEKARLRTLFGYRK